MTILNHFLWTWWGTSGCQISKVLRDATPVAFINTRAAASVSSAERRPEILNRNMSFRRADPLVATDDRPLVVMYGWLAAKARHIHHYSDFYIGRGFDVLNIKILPTQLMWPQRTQSVIDEILSFIVSANHRTRPLIVHGFSVGGYLYGETLSRLAAQPDTAGRIRGQIFDSPVDMDGIAYGVSQALFTTPFVQTAIEKSLDAYLGVLHDQTMVYYSRASAAFHANTMNVPSLFLYSESDLIGAAARIEEVMTAWRERGIRVSGKRWKTSKHVCHLHQHPVEYIGALDAFLTDIGFGRELVEPARRLTAAV